MENQRDPKVSRAAAKDAAARLRHLTLLLKDESPLTRILSEADKTIRQHHLVTAAMSCEDTADDIADLRSLVGDRQKLFAYKQ